MADAHVHPPRPQNEPIRAYAPGTRERASVKRRLAELGFVTIKRRSFERNFLFDFPDLRLRKANSVVRVRFEGKQSLLTFKGAPVRSRDYKIRREIETYVDDGHRLREILEALGLRRTFCYEKYRTTYGVAPMLKSESAGVVVYDETPIGKIGRAHV